MGNVQKCRSEGIISIFSFTLEPRFAAIYFYGLSTTISSSFHSHIHYHRSNHHCC